ncbi:MAG: hypothetical protein II567_08830 [Candidatus Riflebacteria bacterium]|nr:hypothetical protein [Candidatus Riflebacteria bacterium]
MKDLSIDIETFSSVSLKDCGLYRYIESDDFEILLFSYSEDFGDPICIDLAQGEKLPEHIIRALNDPSVVKHAYNAVFEINAIGKFWATDYRQWVDTMILSAWQALPLGLGAVGVALGLSEDRQKLKTGRALIDYFSTPCKPTRANGQRTRNLPEHDAEKWKLYKEYNRQDVVTEMEVYKRVCDVLKPEEFPPREMEVYRYDFAINRTGIRIDLQMVSQIISDDLRNRNRLTEEAMKISGLENPNSPTQLMEYLRKHCSLNMKNLQAENVASTIRSLKAENGMRPRALRLLEIRQALSKTSITKYYTMRDAVCADGRIKGLFQYYGSSTGRWAGRLVQLQNLKRNSLPALETAREFAKTGKIEEIEMVYGDLSDVHSQLCRTALVPEEGKHFVVADFSAIEARVLAWLAGEDWVLDVFRKGRDIYCETASQMFGVPVEKHGVNSELRQKGKIAVLALGYGGGSNALRAMGGDKMGLSIDELEDIVEKYRNANSCIRRFWWKCNEACIKVTKEGKSIRVGKVEFGLTEFNDKRKALYIRLPSGRKLYYQEPHLTTNRFGSEAFGFWSVNSTTKTWGPEESYGGKIVENITQAVARDCLVEVMLRIPIDWKRGRIVMHVHDEIVLEADPDVTSDDICRIMSKPIAWARDLPLAAAGFESDFYKKD